MVKYLIHFFGQKWVLFFLLLINIFGTIYGYYWYKNQLANTPSHFYIFVPDSPTASLFFVFVLILFLFRKNWPLMEALAAVTLIKYGIWAVVMNIGAGAMGASLTWENYMLIGSHLAMAVQALIFSPYYRIRPIHLIIVAVWTLHNDVIDYIFLMHPGVSRYLYDYIQQIGYFTFWLTIVSLLLVYLTGVKEKRYKLNLP